jgi:hypothetical protein
MEILFFNVYLWNNDRFHKGVSFLDEAMRSLVINNFFVYYILMPETGDVGEVAIRKTDIVAPEPRMTLNEAREAMQKMLAVDPGTVTSEKTLQEGFSQLSDSLSIIAPYVAEHSEQERSPIDQMNQSAWVDDGGVRVQLNVYYPNPDDWFHEKIPQGMSRADVKKTRQKHTTPNIVRVYRNMYPGPTDPNENDFYFQYVLYEADKLENYGKYNYDKLGLDVSYGRSGKIHPERAVHLSSDSSQPQPQDYSLAAEGIQAALTMLAQRDQIINQPSTSSPPTIISHKTLEITGK